MRGVPGLLGLVIAAGAAWVGNQATANSQTLPRTLQRTNHAGQPISLAEGPIAVGSAVAGLVVAGGPGLAGGRGRAAGLVAVLGSGAVGAYDDLLGTTQAKGFRGHLGALRQGQVTSGMIKIAGVGASALVAAVLLTGGRSGTSLLGQVADVGLDTALIAGTANLINLCDLRPGRAAKVIGLLGIPLFVSGSPTVGPVLGAALGSLPADLGERAMLGDCGANALGSGLATAAAARLPRGGRVLALAAVAALNLASERVSFTAVVENHRVLSAIDRWGRRR